MWSVLNDLDSLSLLTLFMAVFGYHIQLPNFVLKVKYSSMRPYIPGQLPTSSTVIGMHILYSFISILSPSPLDYHS